MSAADCANWLLGIRPSVRRWVGEQCWRQREPGPGSEPHGSGDLTPANEGYTRAYADLTLAFGLARLGITAVVSRPLVEEARQEVDLRDEAHAFLFRAYEYRIHQALESTPGRGPLPAELLNDLERLSRPSRGTYSHSPPFAYTIDRLRSRSKVLEPHGKVNPYRHCSQGLSEWLRQLWSLGDITDSGQLSDRIHKLLQACAKRSVTDQADAIKVALEQSPRLEESSVRELLLRVPPLVEQLPDLRERAALLEAAIDTATYFGWGERALELVSLLHELLHSPEGVLLAQSQDQLVRVSVRALRQFGLWQEMARLLSRQAELILQGESPAHLRMRLSGVATPEGTPKGSIAPLPSLLYVAGGWFDLGLLEPARQVLDEVWALLVEDAPGSHQRLQLACAYAYTLGRTSLAEGFRRGEEIFQRLRVSDRLTTWRHYSLAALMVVESLVLAVAGEESQLASPRPLLVTGPH